MTYLDPKTSVDTINSRDAYPLSKVVINLEMFIRFFNSVKWSIANLTSGIFLGTYFRTYNKLLIAHPISEILALVFTASSFKIFFNFHPLQLHFYHYGKSTNTSITSSYQKTIDFK